MASEEANPSPSAPARPDLLRTPMGEPQPASPSKRTFGSTEGEGIVIAFRWTPEGDALTPLRVGGPPRHQARLAG